MPYAIREDLELNIRPFRFSETFLEQYKTRDPKFGFNGLGELVYMRSYSRTKEDGTKERWWETVRRVVEGLYTMQKTWIMSRNLGWDARKSQKSAQEMYDRIFTMKFLPPGRGLWALGTAITEEKKLYAALNNCSFVSTNNLKEDLTEPFVFLMDMSMLGVGVGFDTLGASTITVQKPNINNEVFYIIPDSREGWVESLHLLLLSYFTGENTVSFDYSEIRPEGAPIKGFGGESSGYVPLKQLHDSVRETLNPLVGKKITSTAIVDIMNLIGRCVVSGNVRRSAEIAFGLPEDEQYLDLKNYEVNPERASYGWASNNSIVGTIGMDYSEIAKRIQINGEPGVFWLDSARAYSRMNNGKDWKDARASGANPCSEQTLESYELCCLVETFPNRHADFEDYKKTLKYAYLYAKTITLGQTHLAKTNRVMLRNRRIGTSMTGLAQFIADKGLNTLREWSEAGYEAIQHYDAIYSDWLSIPKSIKTTSIKPSGSVSLLAGATPGIHFPESQYYIRRVRLGKDSDLVKPLVDAGYVVEPAIGQEDTTVVVEFPVSLGDNIRTIKDVSMWEQLALAAFMQRHWSDNQVSITVTFDPETEGKDIEQALNIYQYQLKSVSFLPRLKKGAYPQMPYEEIDRATYELMASKLKKTDLSTSIEESISEKFCNNDVCSIF